MFNRLKTFIPKKLKDLSKDLIGYNFISNHFGTKYKKRVLISYITKPFRDRQNYSHTNFHECIAIANVFDKLGYTVDIINYTKFKNYDLAYYDVIFGLGEAVEFALKERSKNNKTPFVIWHGTGSSPFFSNPLTIQRLKYSYDDTGSLFLESTRFLEKIYPLSYIFSDLIILYGNEFTKSTYRDYTFSPIELITPTTYFSHLPEATFETNTNYFWFGSEGAIHKGLDLLIHYFSRNTNLTLHICGNLQREKRFFKFYESKILKSPNIKYHGFVDISSDTFKALMKIGTFTILPSCSEGIATSVLTTMANGGMIPIVTKNSGIDIFDYGIEIEDLSLSAVEAAIATSQRLSEKEILRRKEKIISHTRAYYTIENFSKNLERILIKHLRT